MNVKEFPSWHAFEKEIQKELQKHRQSQLDATPYDLLFRGQSDATWHLETTLERYGTKNIPILNYFSMIDVIQNQIETFTENKWRNGMCQ